ncbi:MAG TPA: hypothetical protein DGF10_08135 [Acidimicrobiaceae bacterium]|nr:hypothetical protein [Acidimicrobiaceae bacterium]
MAMNHARIATEALRFRMGTFSAGSESPPILDPDEAGAILVACCDPGVDHALRLVGETWFQAGLSPEQIDHPWSPVDVARLRSVGGTRLLDALDELVTGVSRCRVRH